MMRADRVVALPNPGTAPLSEVPDLPEREFRDTVIDAIELEDARLATLFAMRLGEARFRLVAALARGGTGTIDLCSTVVGRAYPALTPDCPQAQAFERALAEDLGPVPEGHPWLKPLRLQGAGRASDARPLVADRDLFRVEGEEIHEVAVGPVHAGVIEPGHFRFQCLGERVLHLEIALGYQHRGIARAMAGGPGKRSLHYMETLAGDSSVGHATAYAQIAEALGGSRVPVRAEYLRGIALELERLANHTGDLGALANDVGYLPAASHCGRLRGDFLNLTAALCGSRFGRGLVRPGGVRFDVEPSLGAEMSGRLEAAMADVAGAAGLLWSEPSVLARFEGAGVLTRDLCLDAGIVGVPARACGLERDARSEFPSGIYRFSHVPISTWHSGDVFARAQVRWIESQRAASFVKEQIAALPSGPIAASCPPPAAGRIAVSMVEGWRGEIFHAAVTDDGGRFALYDVVDPSVHNWLGLTAAMRDQPISDFPLCNKSFNLSYCGHDL